MRRLKPLLKNRLHWSIELDGILKVFNLGIMNLLSVPSLDGGEMPIIV